jgi:hypothetical protein
MSSLTKGSLWYWPLYALIGIAAAWLGWIGLERLAALLVYPFPHDGLEGTLLYEARLLRAGEALYQPLERYRFLSAPYPPVHYLFLAVFDLIPGCHVFWGGRLLSASAALAVSLLAALIVRRSGSSWLIAALAAGMVLSIPPLQLWGSRIKPDMVALFWTSCGLLCSTIALSHPSVGRPGWGLRLLAAACFACAFFSKQTAVAGALASGIAMLAADWRDRQTAQGYTWRFPFRWTTVWFAGCYLLLTLGTWSLLDLITNGQYTLHVWWGGERSRWWSFNLFRKIVGLLSFWWPQMLIAAIVIPLAWRRRALFVPACYLLIAPLTLLGAGEQGAHHNHLLETHLALAIAGCAVLGVAISELPTTSSTRLRWGRAAVLLLLASMQVYQASHPPEWYAGELAPDDPPERFLTFMRNTPGEILADDTGLLFQAGRDLRYNDPSTMGPAAAIGAWDQSGLVEEIRAKRFSAIMIPVNAEKTLIDPSGRWTPEMLLAIRESYQIKFRDRIVTYEPRP